MIETATNEVVAHWPTSNTPLHYVFSTDFHPKNTHLVLGNARGRALLYSLSRPSASTQQKRHREN